MPQSKQKLDSKQRQRKINKSLASYVKGILSRMDQLEEMILNVNKRLCELEGKEGSAPNERTDN